MRHKREVPGQRESARPGQRILERPSVGSNYSTSLAGKTIKPGGLFLNLHRQIIKNDFQGLHLESVRVYPKSVTEKPVTRFGDRNRQRRTSAHTQDEGAFFVPDHLRYGGLCGGDLRVCWNPLSSSSPTSAQAASHCLATVKAVPKSDKGTDTMTSPLIALHTVRADAHRAMARAALRSDSSLSVRRNRYNQHMTKARAALACARRYAETPETTFQENRHA